MKVNLQMKKINRIEISGFKSIKQVDLNLGNLNIVIGSNGAGKSNFISVFGLLRSVYLQELQHYVRKSGGSGKILHFGPKVTSTISLKVAFESNSYSCLLDADNHNSLFVADERVGYYGTQYQRWIERQTSIATQESLLRLLPRNHVAFNIASYVKSAIESWKVFHFHDTSNSAAIKQLCNVSDNLELSPDAANLAPLLLRLKRKYGDRYQIILSLVQRIAPFIADFFPQEIPEDVKEIGLQWRHVGSESIFDANQLSDGTLRSICLIVLLNQPKLPTTVLIDEPELGLHPAALTLMANLFQSVSSRTQIIVSTQSVPLLNHFCHEDIIVVDRESEASSFKRLDKQTIENWMEFYGIGEMWEKNLIGGRPT
jgi:predicted ATPase